MDHDADLDDLVQQLALEACARARLGVEEPGSVLGWIDDAALNQVDDEADAPRVRAALVARVEATFAALPREEATWPARTTTERVEAALADLASKGQPVSRFARLDRGGGLHQRMDAEPWEPLAEATWLCAILLTVLPGSLEAEATLEHAEASRLRGVELEAAANEVVRVLRHHGVDAAYDAERRHVRLAPFPWQRRRTTASPEPEPPAPPAPVARACPLCGGKGWVVQGAGAFPSRCACKDP